MQSTVAVLVRFSGGGWWGRKWQRRDATRPRICILFASFCVLILVCISFYAHNGAVLCIFVYRTTNFYAVSAPKIFKRILITDSMNPIVHHVLFFKFLREDEIVSMFYACCPHVLCIVPMSIIHFILGSMMLVEVTTVVLGGMSIL
jgi:hypothetical protein